MDRCPDAVLARKRVRRNGRPELAFVAWLHDQSERREVHPRRVHYLPFLPGLSFEDVANPANEAGGACIDDPIREGFTPHSLRTEQLKARIQILWTHRISVARIDERQ
jgi:hypothetical protein